MPAVPQPRRKRRGLVLGGLGVIAAVAATSIAFVAGRNTRESSAAEAITPPPATSVRGNATPSLPARSASMAPAPTSAPTATPTSIATATPPVLSTATLTVTLTAPSTPTPIAKRGIHPSPPPRSTSAACNPPFTVDAQGFKKYKIECL